MTTILKGYYLKVTLENRLVKHNGRKVYLSIVEHGNGIPDHALILKTSAKCMKFSVCLSIRSQCGWKELDQNESGELTFDLKVEVNGKSQRAPLFPLIFQLCEKHYDQVVILSKSVIPVKAITKIPKKSLRAELVPLGENEIRPPTGYLASPGDASTTIDEDMVEEDENKDDEMNGNNNNNNGITNDEEDEDDSISSCTMEQTQSGSLRSSSSSVNALKKVKIQHDDNYNGIGKPLEYLPNLRTSSPNISSLSTLSSLINQDTKTHSLDNLLNSNNNNNSKFMSGLLLSTTNNSSNNNPTKTNTSTNNKKKRQLSVSAPNVPQALNINNNNSSNNSSNYSISNITNNINNGFNNFKALTYNKPAALISSSSSISGADLDPLNYLSTLALQNNTPSTITTTLNNNIDITSHNNSTSPTSSPPSVVPNTPPIPSSPPFLGSGISSLNNSNNCVMTSASNNSISRTLDFCLSPDTEKSPPINGIKSIINSTNSTISSISSSINNHFNNHKHLMASSGGSNNINNLLSHPSPNINLSSLLLSQTPSSFPSINSNNPINNPNNTTNLSTFPINNTNSENSLQNPVK